jgi:hypothetical protein
VLLTKTGGTLFVQAAGERPAGEIVDWLAPTRPRALAFGQHRVIRAVYAPAPQIWQTLFSDLLVDMIVLQPDGGARIDVVGPHHRITEFSSMLTEGGGHTQLRQVGPMRDRRELLTAAQEAALRAAVSAGYYKIPRPLNLHALARRVDVTAASLSERLRRAEGRVITQYVELGCPPLERSAYDDPFPLLGLDSPWPEESSEPASFVTEAG